MENAIIAQNIKRYFKAGDGTTVHALDGVSMEIKKGTLAILKGRSGSGKTTLLNILSALDMPTEGSVQFLDKNLEQMTEKDREMLRRYEMGFVFQSIALIPTMTAYENVEFALRLAKTDVINANTENTQDRVSELLERVGLSKRMDHMPDQLSGGEQQRVAIARAVAHHPKVVFADEPTGALDTAAGFEVMRLFRELIDDEDITIVMTTHDPNLMELGDEVFELSDGIVI
ncbi:ABC transporter ATP-binding protein [Agathobacter sp.]